VPSESKPATFPDAFCFVKASTRATAIPSVSPNPLPFMCLAFNSARRASHLESLSFCGPAFGVGQPVSCTISRRFAQPPIVFRCPKFPLGQSVESNTCGVGHPIQSLPDVRRADARSAGIDRPDGVILAFQVSANMVEPSKCVTACNLLAKDNDRAALADEFEPRRP
jgi:hypothetical protein